MTEESVEEDKTPNPRPLTAGEIALARSLFKSSISYTRVRIHKGKHNRLQPDNSGLTPNGEIWVAGDLYRTNYAVEQDVRFKAFFIHEMVHVWQHQNRVLNVVGSAISEFFAHWGNYNAAYRYKLEMHKDLLDYDIEQQAAIVQNYYLLRQQAKPEAGFLLNTERGSDLLKLHEAVVQRFLQDPTYARGNMDRQKSPNRDWSNR